MFWFHSYIHIGYIHLASFCATLYHVPLKNNKLKLCNKNKYIRAFNLKQGVLCVSQNFLLFISCVSYSEGYCFFCISQFCLLFLL